MSLRKMSGIVPEVMAEIQRMVELEKRERKREGVQACNACDPAVENRPVDPRKRVGRERAIEQLDLGLTITK